MPQHYRRTRPEDTFSSHQAANFISPTLSTTGNQGNQQPPIPDEPPPGRVTTPPIPDETGLIGTTPEVTTGFGGGAHPDDIGGGDGTGDPERGGLETLSPGEPDFQTTPEATSLDDFLSRVGALTDVAELMSPRNMLTNMAKELVTGVAYEPFAKSQAIGQPQVDKPTDFFGGAPEPGAVESIGSQPAGTEFFGGAPEPGAVDTVGSQAGGGAPGGPGTPGGTETGFGGPDQSGVGSEVGSGGAGGGAGGAGDCVIFQELLRQGLCKRSDLYVSIKYHQGMMTPALYAGYLAWAAPWRDGMRKSERFARFSAPMARCWAREMGYRLGKRRKPCYRGKAVSLVFDNMTRICARWSAFNFRKEARHAVQ